MNNTTNSPTAVSALAALVGISKAAAEIAQHTNTLAQLISDGHLGALGAASADRTPKPKPTREQCQDPRNKIGVNLSPRGLEIIYRLFDHGSSVRGASLAMGISHRAAKWRKGTWEKAGGNNRPTMILDSD